MAEEFPKQFNVENLTSRSSVIYSRSLMNIERRINVLAQIVIGIFAILLLIFFFSSPLENASSKTVMGYIWLLALAGILIFFGMSERSYRYEFDKAKETILCQWGGVLGTSIDKTESMYSLSDIDHLRIDQNTNRGRDSFKIRLVLRSGKELNMPSGNALGQCMEYANVYRDFLELQTPIKLPK